MPLTFIHAADVHLGRENYGGIDAATGLSRRLLDTLAALESLRETAFNEAVDFVVLAGDIYKNANPNATTQRELARWLKKFSDAALPVIIIVGNHDQANSFGKAHALAVFDVLSLPHIYVVDSPRLIRLSTKNGAAQILAVPWPTRAEYFTPAEMAQYNSGNYLGELENRVSAKVAALTAMAEPEIPLLLFGHLMVEGASFSGTERMYTLGAEPVIKKSALLNARFSYVGLGHVHKFQELNRGHQPPLFYAGSLHRIDFQEKDEKKGFILGEVTGPEVAVRFMEVEDRPFLELEINLTDETEPTAEFLLQLDEYELSQAVVKIFYGGTEKALAGLNWRSLHAVLKTCHHLVSVIPRPRLNNKKPRLLIHDTFAVERVFDEYVRLHPDLAPDAKSLRDLLGKLIQEATEL